MATLNWQTPNSTTGSIDLSKISLDDGSFTIHAKNSSSDYTLVGSHDHPDGRLVWNGQYFKVGHNNLASITESVNGDAIFYIEGKSSDEGGAQGTARLYGGSTFDSCASVIVYGTNHPINPGKFVLYARTASDVIALIGNPEDKILYWNSSPVLTTQSDLAASKINGAVSIEQGGTGAATRLTAAKNLLNENVGADATYFLTMTNNFANIGYSTIANAKTMLGLGSAAYTDSTTYAKVSHGNHVPATQTANNKVFLRNDNTWQTVTPANIGAATSGHNHDTTYVKENGRGIGYISYSSFKGNYPRTLIQWGNDFVPEGTTTKTCSYNVNFNSDCSPTVVLAVDSRASSSVKIYYSNCTYQNFTVGITGSPSGNSHFRWVAFGY